jgi:TonB family protein
MLRIFISYRREDSSGYAGRLFDSLEHRFGKTNIFMDIDSLAPGVDFFQVINSSVGSCDLLLAVIGKNWLSAKDEDGRARLENPEDFVRLEISAALKRDIRVIPVLVGGARMPRSQELPEELEGLARRQAFALHDDAWRPRIDWLIRNIEAHEETARTTREEQQRREAAEAAQKLERERIEAGRAAALREAEQERVAQEAEQARKAEHARLEQDQKAAPKDAPAAAETAPFQLLSEPRPSGSRYRRVVTGAAVAASAVLLAVVIMHFLSSTPPVQKTTDASSENANASATPAVAPAVEHSTPTKPRVFNSPSATDSKDTHEEFPPKKKKTTESTSNMTRQPQNVPHGPVPIGGRVAEANLMHKVQPTYPAVAKSARVQGTVEFTATISKEGDVEDLQLVRGHPLLVDAARDAVKQWKYRPTLLNGEPVEVITDVILNFTLSQ